MKINEAFPSKYLKAADLQGQRVVAVISHVDMEDIGDDGMKAIVYFQGKKKGVVLNVTNKNMIIEITGSDETNDWHGKEVVLHSVKVDFQGKRVDSIRFDYPPNSQAPAAPVKADAVPF